MDRDYLAKVVNKVRIKENLVRVQEAIQNELNELRRITLEGISELIIDPSICREHISSVDEEYLYKVQALSYLDREVSKGHVDFYNQLAKFHRSRLRIVDIGEENHFRYGLIMQPTKKRRKNE